MKQTTAIIIDDDIKSVDLLSEYLSTYCPKLEVLETTLDFNEGIALVERLKPNIVFLDILLHDNNGFELLDVVGHEHLQVIFISAYKEYAIESIKYGPVDFLLKPFSIKQLKAAVNRAVEKLTRDQTEKGEGLQSQLAVSVGRETRLLKHSDIVFCVSNGNYTTFAMIGGEKIMGYNNLGYFEKRLPEHLFLRIHKKYIVNIQYIKSVYRTDGSYCELTTKKVLPISRTRKDEVQQKIRIRK